MFHDNRIAGKRKRRSRKTGPRLLRTHALLDYALHLSQCDNLNAFAAEYLNNSSPSDVYRWVRKHAINRSSVLAISDRLPGLLELYDLPLFTLFEDRPLGRRAIESLLAPYQTGDELSPWKFPNDEELRDEGCHVSTCSWIDSASLVSRGDIYGFMAIVGLVRWAEAVKDGQSHIFHVGNMYRAFPAVARLPWFRKHYELLQNCVTAIHRRVYTSVLLNRVDWDVIRRQIEAPVHETLRERRPRDTVSGRFVDLEDPVIWTVT